MQVVQPIQMHLATLAPALMFGLIGGLLAALFARLNTFICKRRSLLLAKIPTLLLKRLVRMLEPILIVVNISRDFVWPLVSIVFCFYSFSNFYFIMSADILIDSGLYHTCGNWYLNFHSSPTTFFFNKLFTVQAMKPFVIRSEPRSWTLTRLYVTWFY